MSKFNIKDTRPARGNSPIVADALALHLSHEGVQAYHREAKSELFLLAVANFVGQSTFYEKGPDRDDRFRALIHRVATDDPTWMAGFLGWLRTEANMRTAPLVGALEAAAAMLVEKVPGARRIVASVLQRADEPGEALAYWTSHYGRTIPKPVKRGIADAVARLYTERALLKYDTASHGFRFGDVIDLVHPTPTDARQGDLFKHALDRRHGRDDGPVPLPMILANASLRGVVAEGRYAPLLEPDLLRGAGMTWEDALSLAGDKVDKAKLWTAMIPSMGYMALLRNLRNFDQAGVEDAVAQQVVARLIDPAEVARSRQFPFRFYAAFKAVGSLRWSHPLELALGMSLANVPALPGRTLIVVDQSPSMFPGYGSPSVRTDMTNADMAKLFGTALALRAEAADLVGYGRTNYRVPFHRGDALLKIMVQGFRMVDGTDTFGAVAGYFDPKRHDRVVIVTDEQNQVYAHRSIDDVVPAQTPVYLWNIGGYATGSIGSGPNRNTFGGMTDAAFAMIPLIEAGRNADWPFAPVPVGTRPPAGAHTVKPSVVAAGGEIPGLAGKDHLSESSRLSLPED